MMSQDQNIFVTGLVELKKSEVDGTLLKQAKKAKKSSKTDVTDIGSEVGELTFKSRSIKKCLSLPNILRSMSLNPCVVF